jgi:hypothetical protein
LGSLKKYSHEEISSQDLRSFIYFVSGKEFYPIDISIMRLNHDRDKKEQNVFQTVTPHPWSLKHRTYIENLPVLGRASS